MTLQASCRDVEPFSVLADTDPDVDDGGGQQDTDTLQQVSHHVDESRPHAGVSVAVMVVLMLFAPQQPAAGKAVTVAMWRTRLMQDQDHPK